MTKLQMGYEKQMWLWSHWHRSLTL